MPEVDGPAPLLLLEPGYVSVFPGAFDDPDAPAVPSFPAAAERVVSLVLASAVTLETVGVFESARVREWTDDVELLQVTSASFTVSAWDPMWAAVASRSWLGADGVPVHEWDPRRFVVWICVNGARVWPGVLRSPVRVAGGEVQFSASYSSALFAERILGRAEQVDLLDGAGSFEGSSPLSGWVTVEGSPSVSVVDGGVSGTKKLRINGAGWVRSPKVATMGADGYGRVVSGSAFAKFATDIPEGAICIRTYTQKVGTLAPWDVDYSDLNAGARPDAEEGFTRDPIDSAARMAPSAVAHRTWVELRGFDEGIVEYDLATIRLSESTGFPPGTDRDYAEYVVRIIRDLNARSVGGSPTGLTTRIESMTGNGPLEAMRWPHAQRAWVRDVLASVLEADGGPECTITADWVLVIRDRLGADRNDISLTNDVVLDPGFELDPGARRTDFVVDTGRGSGVSWVSATFSTPYVEDEHRAVAFVTAPAGRSLNEVTEWGRPFAAAAARRQVTLAPTVPWWLAEQINKGDTLWCSLSDGVQGVDERMRVVSMTWLPEQGACRLAMGAVDA